MNILRTRHGWMMVRQGSDFISMNLAQTGEYEWQVVELCNMLAGKHKEGVILDIGANMGTITLPLAKILPQYTVHSYEPQTPVFYQLAGNVALNDLDNVVLHNHAVGEKRGSMWIDLPDYSKAINVGAWSLDQEVRDKEPQAQGGGKQQYVRIEMMDDMHFEKPIRLVKVDVEGQELEVFKGAKYLLQTHNYPPLVYECWQHYDWFKEKAKELDDYVRGMGYETYHAGMTVVAVHPDSDVKVKVTKTITPQGEGLNFAVGDDAL